MSTNTINERSTGQTITADFFNDIRTAMGGAWVGRNTSGVPTSGQSLGTNSLPWGSAYINSLILNGSAVDTSLLSAPKNRVVSGAMRSTSDQPAFIDPAGSGGGASFVVTAATTNLVLDINGTTVTLTTNITKSGLTTAPSTNNTCLVNDTSAADQESTRTWGEYNAEKEHITIDTIGTEISSLNGTFQAFKINDGTNDEYFLAYVDTTNNKLTHIMRGFFYDSSLNPIKRIKFADNDVITLMKLAWIFADDDATTIDVTYRNPVWATVAPGSPQTGDYWYDTANEIWKRYTGSSFDQIDRTFIGWAVINTADCIAARSFDFYAKYEPQNTLELDISTTEIAITKNLNAAVSVAGKKLYFGHYRTDWNITTDLAGSADLYSAAEAASTIYYLYLDSDGKNIISDISPYWRPDFYGWYHPHNPWRCVGEVFNNASSNITMIDESKYNLVMPRKVAVIRDEKTSGTNGGAFTSGAWRTRTLNTTSGDVEFLTLSSNQFVLMPGKYKIHASAPAYIVDGHKAKLADITSTADTLIGTSDSTVSPVYNRSFVNGTFYVPPMSKTYELQHRCETTNGTNGFGRQSTVGVVEVYTEVRLEKLY